MFNFGNKDRVTEVQEVWDQQQIQSLLDKTAPSTLTISFSDNDKDKDTDTDKNNGT
jgi:hypothetical protein